MSDKMTKSHAFANLDAYQQARALGYAAGCRGEENPHHEMSFWLETSDEMHAFNCGLMDGKRASS